MRNQSGVFSGKVSQQIRRHEALRLFAWQSEFWFDPAMPAKSLSWRSIQVHCGKLALLTIIPLLVCGALWMRRLGQPPRAFPIEPINKPLPRTNISSV